MAAKRAAFFHPDSPLPFLLYFLAYLSVLIRVLLRSPEEGAVHEIVYGLLAAFLALSILPTDGDPSVLSWKLQNQGSGTAINIRVWH